MVATRSVPLLDLKPQHETIRQEVLTAIVRVVDSQRFILGEEVAALEREVAGYCHVRHGIGCASGSDAVLLALMALGVGVGDEVLTTPYTFFATVSAITRLSARPVFADIDPATYNIDPAQVVRLIETRPGIKAVIAVHLFGSCAEMNPILEAAAKRGIPVIEDAAQSIGAEYQERRAGSIGRIGCFSFYPTKNLGAYGDGGMLTTNDAELADRLATLRVHGGKTAYLHEVVGVNSRLDAIQAAVLRVKLRHLDSWTAARQRNAARYRELLSPLAPRVTLPSTPWPRARHIWNQFVIRCAARDQLRAFLKERQIGTEIYYPLPLHLQPCFAALGYARGDLPVSERLAEESLALPIHGELSDDDLCYVCEAIAAFVRHEA